MIFLVYGSQGSGKTLFLVKKGYEAHTKGYTVYSNFRLKFPHELLSFDQLVKCELNDCVVLIDEAHIFGFDARESMSKGNRELVKNFIVQVRKQNVSLFMASQRPRQLDARVKSNSDYAMFCTKYIYDPRNAQLIEVSQSQQYAKDVPIIIDIDIVQGDSGKEGNMKFIGNKFFDLYDTREVIRLSRREKEKSIEGKMEDDTIEPEKIKRKKRSKKAVKKNKNKKKK